MTEARELRTVDVFSATPLGGNPVAVVLDGDGLDDVTMQRFANWTNLSETTFVLPPTHADADYRVRIFTPASELPFAGHPTLGTCHAWLGAGGAPRDPEVVVQECAAGRVRIRVGADGLAFAAPPLVRSGPLDGATLDAVVGTLGITHADVVASNWVDNGPGWVGVLLRDAAAVLGLEPGPLDGRFIGVAGPSPAGAAEAFEVRAFFPQGSMTVEDPITGSLNASLAQWFIAAGIATAPYTCRQGTALGRTGLVRIEQPEPGGDVWVGGATATLVSGSALI